MDQQSKLLFWNTRHDSLQHNRSCNSHNSLLKLRAAPLFERESNSLSKRESNRDSMNNSLQKRVAAPLFEREQQQREQEQLSLKESSSSL